VGVRGVKVVLVLSVLSVAASRCIVLSIANQTDAKPSFSRNKLKRPRQRALDWCELCSSQFCRKPALGDDIIVLSARATLHLDQPQFTGRINAEPAGKP
jgi:hypothetical protein